MSDHRWAAIRIGVDGSDYAAEAASEFLLNAGTSGVATDVDTSGSPSGVIGYVPVDDRLAGRLRQIEAALAFLPSIGIDGVAAEAAVSMIDEQDWANGWKQYFKPIRIGRRLVVGPPWERPQLRPGDHSIVIDPGMAFGTGTHATTQLCLAALEDYITPDTRRVADVGTGSGILAIAAKMLGAADVFAYDTDPLAVRIARENADANRVELVVAEDPDWSVPFDLIVANILADTLIGLAERFASAVSPGGIYIASGIIDEREGDVRLYTEAEGFQPIETRRQAEWVALIFRRSSD